MATSSIIDNKNADIYKLNLSGNDIRQFISNFKLKDIEVVAADEKFVYGGDIGDNNGT